MVPRPPCGTRAAGFTQERPSLMHATTLCDYDTEKGEGRRSAGGKQNKTDCDKYGPTVYIGGKWVKRLV
jgi:hypothetical protein